MRNRDRKEVPYLSQSIQRALDVLETLAAPDVPDGLSLTEISARLELPKSTVVRLLANLEFRGLVAQKPNRRYTIGLALFSIGTQALIGHDLRRVGRGYLEEVAERTGESAYLAIRVHDEVLYVDRIESPQPVRLMSPIGAHRPLHSTAVGKVLLADLSDEEVEAIIGRTGLPPRTPATITDLATLRLRLVRIREEGYEVDFGEWEEELACLAAPITSGSGRVIAALGVSGPTWRVAGDRLALVAAALKTAAASMSAELAAPADRDEELV